MMKLVSQSVLRNRLGDIDFDIHFEQRCSALGGENALGSHVKDVDPAIGEEPGHPTNDSRMVDS